MECPRCRHRIVPGVLFCPECEAPLKVIWEEINPMGSSVWEFDASEQEESPEETRDLENMHQSQKLSLPVTRDLKPRQ